MLDFLPGKFIPICENEILQGLLGFAGVVCHPIKGSAQPFAIVLQIFTLENHFKFETYYGVVGKVTHIRRVDIARQAVIQ